MKKYYLIILIFICMVMGGVYMHHNVKQPQEKTVSVATNNNTTKNTENNNETVPKNYKPLTINNQTLYFDHEKLIEEQGIFYTDACYNLQNKTTNYVYAKTGSTYETLSPCISYTRGKDHYLEFKLTDRPYSEDPSIFKGMNFVDIYYDGALIHTGGLLTYFAGGDTGLNQIIVSAEKNLLYIANQNNVSGIIKDIDSQKTILTIRTLKAEQKNTIPTLILENETHKIEGKIEISITEKSCTYLHKQSYVLYKKDTKGGWLFDSVLHEDTLKEPINMCGCDNPFCSLSLAHNLSFKNDQIIIQDNFWDITIDPFDLTTIQSINTRTYDTDKLNPDLEMKRKNGVTLNVNNQIPIKVNLITLYGYGWHYDTIKIFSNDDTEGYTPSSFTGGTFKYNISRPYGNLKTGENTYLIIGYDDQENERMRKSISLMSY